MRTDSLQAASLFLVVITLAACTAEQPDEAGMTLEYPKTATVDQVDDYHGTKVADPYRWLEDDVRENPDVKAWVDAQNDLAFGYLKSIEERDTIEKRLTELWDYERYGLPTRAGERYFYGYNDGLQNQNVVYVVESLDAKPELLRDPNSWSEDGTVALAGQTESLNVGAAGAVLCFESLRQRRARNGPVTGGADR